jgi:putative spermidine/putrescine transport system substrate-binding protein
VVKGTPRKEEAMHLRAYITKPDLQVQLANVSGDVPCYPAALARVEPDARRWMPDVGDPNNLFVNAEWDSRIDELTLQFPGMAAGLAVLAQREAARIRATTSRRARSF